MRVVYEKTELSALIPELDDLWKLEINGKSILSIMNLIDSWADKQNLKLDQIYTIPKAPTVFIFSIL